MCPISSKNTKISIKVTGDERPVREREPREREPREPRESDRDRRPPHTVQPAATVPESGEAVQEPTAPISPLSMAAPPESRPDDRGGDRERRGRRSRRRRNNGRGFPDSKYAPTGGESRRSGPPPEISEPRVERTEPSEAIFESESVADEVVPLILPGESLKKYRETPPAPKAACRN